MSGKHSFFERTKLSPSDVDACNRAFEQLTPNNDHDGTYPKSAVKQFFSILGAASTPALLDALMKEHLVESDDTVTRTEIMNLYDAWRLVSAVKLRQTEDFITSDETHKMLREGLFLSDSPLRGLWNIAVMLLALAHWFIVFYRTATTGIERPFEWGFLVMDILLTFVYLADTFLWTRTTVAFSRSQQLRMPPALTDDWKYHLLNPRTILGLLASCPLDWILSAAGASTASGVFSYLRLFASVRCLFLWGNTQGLSPMTTHYVLIYLQVIPLWLLFYVVLALTSAFASIFVIVRKAEEGPPMTFIAAFYYVVQTFTTVGYGDVELTGNGQLWFTILLVVLGLIFNALAIGRLVAMIQLGDANIKREDQVRQTLAVLKYFQIPDLLQAEVLSFQEHVLFSDLAATFYEEVRYLPQSMHDSMLLQYRIDVLNQVPEFHDAEETFIFLIGKALISQCYKPEEYVTCCGDDHQGLRFILFGFVDRLTPSGRYIATFTSGHYFGFDGILEHSTTTEPFNHKALSYTDTLMLPTADFISTLSEFPSYEERFKEMLLTRAQQKKKNESDAAVQMVPVPSSTSAAGNSKEGGSTPHGSKRDGSMLLAAAAAPSTPLGMSPGGSHHQQHHHNHQPVALSDMYAERQTLRELRGKLRQFRRKLQTIAAAGK